MKIKKHVLKNGLRVVFVPMKETQTVAVQILVEAGSKYENKKNNGISHFLEHMMFKGTKKRPTTKIISEIFDSVGGEYNAFTGEELTGYWVKVPAKHFEMAVDVVSDMYTNPLLKLEEINRERGVILQEISMIRDDPARYAWDLFEKLLYGDQPAGWDIIGTRDNIKKFRRKDFTDYIRKMYVPKTTVVTVAGNFDEEKALKLIEKQFSGQKKQKKVGKKKVAEIQRAPKMDLYFKETDQTHLILGVRGMDMFSPDRHAATVLATILGGGMSSRMFINIREREGLTYYIGASMNMTTDAGYLYARAGVEHENLEKAVKLMIKELKKVSTKKVSTKELKKAKEFLKGRTTMSLESSISVASFVGEQELFKKTVREPEKMFEKIDAVTAEDVLKVAKKMVKNSGLNLAVIGPHKEKTNLKKSLKF